MNIRRSALFYVGDKYKILEQIKNHFPNKIIRFIEPFTGGGTVFLNIQAEEYLLNDIDTNLYNLHKYLMKRAKDPGKFFNEVHKLIKKYNLSRSYKEDVVPQRLKKKWKKTYYAKYNKNGYYKLREDFNRAEEKDYLKLYILLIYGFNRMLRFNKNGEYNIPVGNVDFNNNVYHSLENYFGFVRNKKIRWYNLDYIDFLKSIQFKKNDFVYLDPPYLITSSEYNKLWGIKKEKEMLNCLTDLDKNKIKFAVSNVVTYNSDVNEAFKSWMDKFNVYSIESNYISYHNNLKKNIKEVLVTNYE